MKKKACIMLAAVLAAGINTTGYAAFSDINNVPWAGAAAYINRASDLGLMVGEAQNGSTVFRPRDSVTLCETVQLTYSLLKSASNVNASDAIVNKWKSVMTGYKIPAWAHTATAYCLENSIITISDLPNFMSSNGVSNGATREMVATIVGKGLMEVDSSISTGGTSASFNDGSSISTTAAPYVSLLRNEDILSGDGNGNFNPKATINRSEMAVIVTKSYDRLGEASASGTISGFVASVITYGNGVMVTFNSGNTQKSFYMDNSTDLTFKDGTYAKAADISSGILMTVTYDGDDVSSAVIQEDSSSSSSSTSSDKLTGTISDITSSRIRLTGSSKYYYYDDDDPSTYLDDENVDIDELIEAEKDDSIRVTLTLDDDDYVVRIDAETMGDTVKGDLDSISNDRLKIKNGKTYYFDDADDVIVTLDDDSSDVDELIELIDDDEDVYVKLILDKDDEVVEIEAETENNDSDDSGYISSLTMEQIRIRNGERYDIEDEDIDVIIDDDDEDLETLYDLFNDDDETIYVRLTLNSDDEVTEIDAEIRNSDDEDEDSGTISGLTSSRLTLKGGDYYKIEDTDDLDITVDGRSRDYDYLKEAFDDGDTIDVELVIDGDYVIEIDAEIQDKNRDDGDIEAISTNYLELDNGNSYDLGDLDEIDVTLDGSSSDVEELIEEFNDNDRDIYVEIVYDDDDYVLEIDAELN